MHARDVVDAEFALGLDPHDTLHVFAFPHAESLWLVVNTDLMDVLEDRLMDVLDSGVHGGSEGFAAVGMLLLALVREVDNLPAPETWQVPDVALDLVGITTIDEQRPQDFECRVVRGQGLDFGFELLGLG